MTGVSPLVLTDTCWHGGSPIQAPEAMGATCHGLQDASSNPVPCWQGALLPVAAGSHGGHVCHVEGD